MPTRARTNNGAAKKTAAVNLPPALRAYLQRIGAEELNFRRFVIKQKHGPYYTERFVIRIVNGVLVCEHDEFAPTDAEAKAIEAELKDFKFPHSIEATKATLAKLRTTATGTLFELCNRATGGIIMVQERIEPKAGSLKRYVPWTYWSDGVWRMMEPDGLLPFWKPRKARSDLIMVHEGAKVAAAVEDLCTNPDRAAELASHPWGAELKTYEHWGMIGGALVPHRTNYEELRSERPALVVYVCDNDVQGRGVLREFSRHYRARMRGIQFPEKTFPNAWDMADAMPPDLFSKKKLWLGPTLKELMRPATWATEVVYVKRDQGQKKSYRVTKDFRNEWRVAVRPEVYIHEDRPQAMLTADEFNRAVASFSDLKDTATPLTRENVFKSFALKYDPGAPNGFNADHINTYSPSTIVPVQGNCKPWLDFMQHLIEDPSDRTEVLRWCATLIARPGIKMKYAILLISEQQGVGKGTLGEKILRPLVGEHNTSVPSETDITDSSFNHWQGHRRLAIVHEIYAGHSAKAYNALKDKITDENCTVNEKFRVPYDIKNWIHIFACSNSRRALQIAMDDRRWLVPKVTERKKPTAYWVKLNEWLTAEGGLSYIANWAHEFLKTNTPVMDGDAAPWTVRKTETVEEGYSPGQALVANTLEMITEQVANGRAKDLQAQGILNAGGGLFVTDQALISLIKNKLHNGRHSEYLERPSTIAKVAKFKGWYVSTKRYMVPEWDANKVHVIANTEELAQAAIDDLRKQKPYPISGL